jgi:myosin heavy subunit
LRLFGRETTLAKFFSTFSFDAQDSTNKVKRNQTIIALGESGSGKSTLLRKTINQMFVTKNLLQDTLVERLDQRMKLAEILGNAKTSNNDDSSRMGKLIEVSSTVVFGPSFLLS